MKSISNLLVLFACLFVSSACRATCYSNIDCDNQKSANETSISNIMATTTPKNVGAYVTSLNSNGTITWLNNDPPATTMPAFNSMWSFAKQSAWMSMNSARANFASKRTAANNIWAIYQANMDDGDNFYGMLDWNDAFHAYYEASLYTGTLRSKIYDEIDAENAYATACVNFGNTP